MIFNKLMFATDIQLDRTRDRHLDDVGEIGFKWVRLILDINIYDTHTHTSSKISIFKLDLYFFPAAKNDATRR